MLNAIHEPDIRPFSGEETITQRVLGAMLFSPFEAYEEDGNDQLYITTSTTVPSSAAIGILA